VVRIRVCQTGTLEDLAVGVFIVTLGPWLHGVDGVVHWAVAVLPPPRVVLPIMMPIVVVTVAVTVIVALIIVAPLITLVIVAVVQLVRMRSSPNILLDLLVSLISICPLFLPP
jgi:hypothetical protein